MSPVGDLLLNWASENGAGDLSVMLSTVEWASRRFRITTTSGAPGRWVRDASSLGYLDVDWQAGKWSVAPAVLTALPMSGGLLLLTGTRNRAMDSRIEDAAQDMGLEYYLAISHVQEGDIPLPKSVIFMTDPGTDMERLATALKANWVPCFALQVIPFLPKLALGPEAAGPVPGTLLKRYVEETRRYEEVLSSRVDGIYRFKTADHRQVVRLLRDGTWYKTSHEEALYLIRADHPSKPGDTMRWGAESNGERNLIGRLAVDWGAPLPPLHARAAVLSSGLAPWFSATAETAVYYNVPYVLAAAIAESLKQELEILDVSGGRRG
ncbi:hypothetical protein SAMN05443665_105641 [Actinomadura meyerae]|uniref:Uncharacterized protein n=1 Tax=Actinomadura meyerae TaxID=240840 RepID=A0A239NZI1_9ACTN|nr:hypothetical protein [Actinomadura meyerae]SNT60301.1 hypothetical protein SAMN05443665_105641 [Actinomadura meyerae]